MHQALITTYYRGQGYSEEYQAVLDRDTSEGFTQPAGAGKTKENRLITNVKAAGLWDLFDTFHPFATLGSSGHATINWKNPLGALVTPVNSPVHSANGFIGNPGASAYLNLGWAPTDGVNYTKDSAGIYIYVHQAPTSGSILLGHSSSNSDRLWAASTVAQNINGTASLSSTADLSGTGMKAIIRTSDTNVTLYNGTAEITRTGTSNAMTSENIFILRHASSYSDARIGFVATGAALTNTQYLALRTAINTYLSA